MRLLLDTHIWLWSLLEPERLSKRVTTALQSPANELWLSPISVWEVLMLAGRKRIVLEPDADTWTRRALSDTPFQEAMLNHEVALVSRALDVKHQDPADRFLLATARVYGLSLVTADRTLFRAKGVSILGNS